MIPLQELARNLVALWWEFNPNPKMAHDIWGANPDLTGLISTAVQYFGVLVALWITLFIYRVIHKAVLGTFEFHDEQPGERKEKPKRKNEEILARLSDEPEDDAEIVYVDFTDEKAGRL